MAAPTDPLFRGAVAPLARVAAPGRPAQAGRARSLAKGLAPLFRPLEAAAGTAAPRHRLLSSAAVSPSTSAPLHSTGLTGRWRKDKAASDSMDAACDAVALPWVLRKAVGVVKVLELEDTPVHFQTRLKAGGILDIVETYPWDGSEVKHGRRDKRRGGHRGCVERVEGGEGAAIRVAWDDPYGGTCVDAFTVSPDGRTLTQATRMVMARSGAVVEYKTVFRREAARG